MRSLKLCLLVFLTSCMLDTINASNKMDTEFCGQSKQIGTECKEKDKAHEDDFSWTVASSFGLQHEIPEEDQNKYVEIDMHRALYVTKTEDNINGVEFFSNDKEQCQLLFMRKSEAKDANTAKSIYNSQKIPFSGNAASFNFEKDRMTIIAVVDPKCRMYTKKVNFMKADEKTKKAQLFHVFLRNIKAEKLDSSVLKKGNNAGDLNLGKMIFSQRKSATEGNVHENIVASNSFFELPPETGAVEECNHQCKHGHLFVYTVTARGTFFANKFKMSKTCEWMSIYFDSEVQRSAEISLRHGFVKLPTEVKVYPMDFEILGETVADGPAYEVNVMYIVEDRIVKGAKPRRLEITNSHGRAVRSFELAMAGNTETIRFAFSHDTCLKNFIGSDFINEPTGSKKYEPTGFEFAPSMNLAHKVGSSRGSPKVWTAKSYASTPDPLHGRFITDAEIAASFTIDEDIPVANDEAVIITTTKAVTLSANASHPAATPVIINSLSPGEIEEIAKHAERVRAYLEKEKRISEGSYYFWWSIPAGFASGSFGTFIICNILMFIFNRSILTFWYKAMYKRYGSDTTMGAGTTMGKTMGGETIGGGTTMGGTTAGGTTAGGETTGSTTAA